jgi:hypothetical protein
MNCINTDNNNVNVRDGLPSLTPAKDYYQHRHQQQRRFRTSYLPYATSVYETIKKCIVEKWKEENFHKILQRNSHKIYTKLIVIKIKFPRQ